MMNALFEIAQKLRITQLTDEEFKACMKEKKRLEKGMVIMSKDKATVFWNLILAYGDSQFSLGNQGNSGEFHSDKEEASIKMTLAEDEKALIFKFADVTGWRPVRVEASEANQWKESWQLEDVS